jgi:hypothetical protein
MRRVSLPKGRLNFPDPKRTYDRNGKDDIIKYIQLFDRVNQLVPGGTFVKGKQI